MTGSRDRIISTTLKNPGLHLFSLILHLVYQTKEQILCSVNNPLELELLTSAKKDFAFNMIKSDRYLSVASILVYYVHFFFKNYFLKMH